MSLKSGLVDQMDNNLVNAWLRLDLVSRSSWINGNLNAD